MEDLDAGPPFGEQQVPDLVLDPAPFVADAWLV
jgi:hypothetical protein